MLHTVIASSISSTYGIPFFSRYLPTIMSTFETTPVCTRLDENPVFSRVLDDPIVQSICDHGFAMSLDSKLQHDEIVQMWAKTFAQRGIHLVDLRKSSSKSLSKASMRLASTISGALIACGCEHLPQKLTHLIRALMTSLKNEESGFRRGETCRHISKLVSILSTNLSHEKAREKLIENVCILACSRDANHKSAERVIELLVRTEKVEDLSPLWCRLTPLIDSNYPNMAEEVITDSMYMLKIVSGAMSKGCSSLKVVLHSFIRSTVEVACTTCSEPLHDSACLSVRNLCKIDFCATMEMALPSLLSNVSDLQIDQRRIGGFKLLVCILHEFEVLASPYVMELLPMAMRSMTDTAEECSRLAACCFSTLVRIAPLAASHLDRKNDDPTCSVIRHLILGQPLPPCEMPEIVLANLGKSGTILRPYQMEGIAWLRFLADVHLNGALCECVKNCSSYCLRVIYRHFHKSYLFC